MQCSGEEYNRCVDLYTGLFSLSNLVTGSDFEQNEWKTSTEIQGGVQRTMQVLPKSCHNNLKKQIVSFLSNLQNIAYEHL